MIMDIRSISLHIGPCQGKVDPWVSCMVVVLTFLPGWLIFSLRHLFFNKGGCEIGKEKQFVVSYFGQLLSNFNKMVVFNVNPSTIRYQYESWIELSDLIQQKISDDKSDKITFMILNILLCL